jgi:AraC-like DNA-binding protein
VLVELNEITRAGHRDTALRVGKLVSTRQAVELVVGVLYRVLRSPLGNLWRPAVHFSHDAPRQRATHRRLFSGHVAFGEEINGIVCSSRDLDRAIQASDSTLAHYVRQHLEALMERPNASTADKVRELVSFQLASGRCTADHVARQLGVDRRTLHRHLAAEQQTFSAIVDAVRLEIVTRTLPSRSQRLTTLADMLGFSCLSAFSRWFRVSFGASPSDWRARATARE